MPTEEAGPLALEAAVVVGQPELYPELERLVDRLAPLGDLYLLGLLDEALDACKPA